MTRFTKELIEDKLTDKTDLHLSDDEHFLTSRLSSPALKVNLISPSGIHQITEEDRYKLLFCIRGSMRFRSEGSNFELLPNQLQFLRPDQGLHLIAHGKETAYYKIDFSKDFLSQGMLRETLLENLFNTSREMYPLHVPIFKLNAERGQVMRKMFERIQTEFNSDQPMHEQMIRLLFMEMVLEIIRSDEHFVDLLAMRIAHSRNRQLTNKFTALVNIHFDKYKSVQRYADMLFVTAKHLSEVVKEETGLTALNVIHNKIFAEARFMLCRTELSIKEISDRLDFDTGSHFSRFIKQCSGYNPSDYRKIQCSIEDRTYLT